MVFISTISMLLAVATVLIFPLILAFRSEAEFGAAMSMAAVALVGGSLLMTAWGGPRRRIYGVLGFVLSAAAGLTIIGLRPSLLLVTVGLVVVFFACHSSTRAARRSSKV